MRETYGLLALAIAWVTEKGGLRDHTTQKNAGGTPAAQLFGIDCIKLELQTTEIRFGEVHVSDAASTSLWVPLQVTVTTVWNGQVLRDEHLYSSYKLPGSNTKIQPGQPKPYRHPRRTEAPLPQRGSLPQREGLPCGLSCWDVKAMLWRGFS